MDLTTDPADRRYPDWKTPSPKEDNLNRALLGRTSGKVHQLLGHLLSDEEINLHHSYANVVSVRRLGYNDHGAVHARIVTYNALKLLRLLQEGGIQTSLEKEQVATFEASQVAVALGAFLHDVGMGVTRDAHEWHALTLADEFIRDALARVYPDDRAMQIALRAMAHEVIVGHMGHARIHSIEAGAVLVADGTDMSRGRSRIPLIMDRDPMVGDIHRFSADAVERVELSEGENKPVRITVKMNNVTGLFQIEEVLMSKIKASPIMPYMEVCAMVNDGTPRFYLR